MDTRSNAGESRADFETVTAPKRERASRHDGPTQRAAIVLLVLVMALGGALRAYRLEAQSIWLDEYPSVAYLEAPDAGTNLTLIQMLLPEQAQGPLYYILQYYWAHWVGMALVILRLLPLILGVATAPLVYAFGSYVYGRRAGLIAALCLALSPQHIWHAQEIRPYTLFTLLAVVSMYALLRAVREGGVRWWGINLATNCLVVWTHVFGVLLLVVEGCFLLIFGRRRFRRPAAWACIQVLLLIPWFVWMARMPHTYTSELPSRFHTVRGVFNDIVADEVVSCHSDLLPSWKTNPPEALAPPLPTLLVVRHYFDFALIAVLCCCPVWLLVRIVRAWRRHARARDEETGGDFENEVFLLVLLVLPGLLLGALTFITGHPFLSPMYSMYNTVSLYLVLGAIVSRVKHLFSRGLAVVVLVVLYGYQLVILLPDVTRTDWRAAARYIETHATREDLVLDIEHFWPGDYLSYYLDGSGIPTRRITTFHGACEDACHFVYEAQPEGNRRVWVAFERAFFSWLFPAFDVQAALETGFAERGLAFTRQDFLGHYNLVLYCVERGPRRISREAPGPAPGPTSLDYDHILEKLGLTYADPVSHAEAVAALRKEVGIWPPLCKFFLLVHGADLLAAGEFELGEAVVRKTIERYPSYGLAYFVLGLARASEGDCGGAMKAFEEGFSRYGRSEKVLRPFVTALCETGDPEATRAEIEKLEEMRFMFTPALRQVYRVRFADQASQRRAPEAPISRSPSRASSRSRASGS